jgi:hypothetical protein
MANMGFGIKNNLVYCKRRDNKIWTIQIHWSQDTDLRQNKTRTQPKTWGEPMCSRRESTSSFGKSLVGDIWKKKEMVNISNICWWTRQFCYYHILSLDMCDISSRERTLSKYYFFLKIVLNLNNWEVVESCIIQEKFEYTKGVIKSRKSKDRQYNGQQKKDKETDLQNITQHCISCPSIYDFLLLLLYIQTFLE